MFIAKAVMIIRCDRQFSLIHEMLSFQRNCFLITPLTVLTQIVISITLRFLGYVHTVPDRFLLRFESCSGTM